MATSTIKKETPANIGAYTQAETDAAISKNFRYPQIIQGGDNYKSDETINALKAYYNAMNNESYSFVSLFTSAGRWLCLVNRYISTYGSIVCTGYGDKMIVYGIANGTWTIYKHTPTVDS